MIIARSINKLRQELLNQRANRARFASLVVASGNLHDGHLAVINAAETVSDLVVVAFVPKEDEDHANVVSSTEFADIGFLERHNVDILFVPPFTDMYPDGVDDVVQVAPIHTDATLAVAPAFLSMQLKLINAVQPDVLVCGDKKFVEHFHVRRMLEDLTLSTQVHCVPTVRDSEGIAISAETANLPANERAHLSVLNNTLNDVAHAIRNGARNFSKLENTARIVLRRTALPVVQFAVLDARSLRPAGANTTSFRIIGRVKLGAVYITDSLGLTL